MNGIRTIQHIVMLVSIANATAKIDPAAQQLEEDRRWLAEDRKRGNSWKELQKRLHPTSTT